ncbi:hypothetical protein NMY22_g10297 [Coprinellus aureogranulatus]|nr:hypothetical protein NMY22_g10297 [Coprinellus aureogranulatus]
MNESSPFARYFDTNYVPSEDEVPVIKHLIQEREDAAHALADQIEEMKKDLARMETLHACHHRFIDEHRKLLSPVRALPEDVLTLIFFACIEDVDQQVSRRHQTHTSRKHPSVVVSHVCAEWRALALRTPNLWARIHVEMPCLETVDGYESAAYAVWCKNFDAMHRRLQVWVERSFPCPVDLDFRSGYVCPEVQHSYQVRARKRYEALADTVRSSSSSWRRVYFWLLMDDGTKPLVHSLAGTQFPSLTSLSMNVHQHDEPPPSQDIVMCVQELAASPIFAAPNLRDLELYGMWSNIQRIQANSAIPLYVSVANLKGEPTFVDEEGSFGYAKVLCLLKALPNLVTVDILVENNDDLLGAPTSTPIPISLPYLTSMTIYSFSLQLPTGLGPSLSLPVLQSLHIRSWDSHIQPNPACGDLELLLQYGRQLKELSLHHASLTREALSRCMKQLSNVVILELIGKPARKTATKPDKVDLILLTQLSLPDHFPQLEALRLRDISNHQSGGVTEHAFVELLARRRGRYFSNGGTGDESSYTWERLHVVQISFQHQQQVDIQQELYSRAVDLVGVTLNIKYPKLDLSSPESSDWDD